MPNSTEGGWFPGRSSPYSTAEAVVIGALLFAVILVTVVGNILVCVAVCLVRKLRRPCNYLLVSLAVSDLCVAILVMPMALLYEILGSWKFGPIMCDVWVSFDVLSCTASILNLCMISVDRYYAITKPLEYGVKRTPKRMIACVSLVWLGAACISLPPLLILGNTHGETHDRPGLQCLVCQDFAYQIYATVGSFYLPLSVMMFVYYKIFRAARKIVEEERRAQTHLETSHCFLEISKNGSGPESRLAGNSPSRQQHRTSTTSTNTTTNKYQPLIKDLPLVLQCSSSAVGVTRVSSESQCPMLSRRRRWLPPQPAGPSRKLRFQLAKERKASTTLGIIMSAFTICWLPFFVLALVRPFLSDPGAIPNSLSSLFLWLGYANSLLNPVIYATLNRDFRRPFQQILYFRCGSLNHMMREEFYQSQYGDPVHIQDEPTCDVMPVSELRSGHESFL
ncbi:5-hydroxytryptamine receptor 1 isoform X2 [Halyomorpha halys]|uniref:5-hydroxytryptamine receptor 1 isoform X2 n=1 Tax=Halyomorpha halys TaxID=286706 RepID=UPI0006D50DBC|nr:5-hydroxytryptamine receptor 1 isoform X2 [Halyomorpha halys]